jgi:hypothetical protein
MYNDLMMLIIYQELKPLPTPDLEHSFGVKSAAHEGEKPNIAKQKSEFLENTKITN